MDYKFCHEFPPPPIPIRLCPAFYLLLSVIPAVFTSRDSLTFCKAGQRSLLVTSLSVLIHYSATLPIYSWHSEIDKNNLAPHAYAHIHKDVLLYVYTFFSFYYHFNGGLGVQCIKHMHTCLIHEIKLDTQILKN